MQSYIDMELCPILLTPCLYLAPFPPPTLVPLRTYQAHGDIFNTYFCLETFSLPSPALFLHTADQRQSSSSSIKLLLLVLPSLF
jgi:hypothetical protein